MFDVSGYEGKKIKVTLENGVVFTAIGVTFILGESFDEEFNSMVVKAVKFIKKKSNVSEQSTMVIYEDEVKSIELL